MNTIMVDLIFSIQFLYFVRQFSIIEADLISFGLRVSLEVKLVLKVSETLVCSSFSKKLDIVWLADVFENIGSIANVFQYAMEHHCYFDKWERVEFKLSDKILSYW